MSKEKTFFEKVVELQAQTKVLKENVNKFRGYNYASALGGLYFVFISVALATI